MAGHSRDVICEWFDPTAPGIVTPDCPENNGDHEPAVIGHEDEHQHEGVTNLQTVPTAVVEPVFAVFCCVRVNGLRTPVGLRLKYVVSQVLVEVPQEDDGEEGNQHVGERLDVPPAENHTCVLVVPGE